MWGNILMHANPSYSFINQKYLTNLSLWRHPTHCYWMCSMQTVKWLFTWRLFMYLSIVLHSTFIPINLKCSSNFYKGSKCFMVSVDLELYSGHECNQQFTSSSQKSIKSLVETCVLFLFFWFVLVFVFYFFVQGRTWPLLPEPNTEDQLIYCPQILRPKIFSQL